MIERYILKTGKFTLFMSWYFRWKYQKDISALLNYYIIWQVIEEGLSPYETYRVFLNAYSWSFDRYAKITSILLYCGFIQPTKYSEGSLSYLKLKVISESEEYNNLSNKSKITSL